MRQPHLPFAGSISRALLVLVFGGLFMAPASLVALEPPPPGMIEQCAAEGTLEQRIADAKAFGNHQADPRLAWRLNQTLRQMAGLPPDGSLPPSAGPMGLPTTGVNKIFALLIAFTDYPASNSQATIESQLFGAGNPADYPYESQRMFYQRSSYGLLDLQGSALGWYTAPYPRSSVLQSTAGRENLIKEAVNYFDSQGHDFTQYDNNGDGWMDYFLVIWTGPHGDWATFWWGYQTYFQDQAYLVDGKRLADYSWQWEAYNYPGPFDPVTPMHETGHALGLPDYYDYDGSVGPDGGLGGLDMMDGAWGDHGAFSKFLLGWLTPQGCVGGGGGPQSLVPTSGSPTAMLAMPGGSAGDPYWEYFMVQHRDQSGNDTGYPARGLLIWHVDARLGTNGWFLYDNSYADHKLLRLMEADGLEEIEHGGGADAGDYYTPGDSFGPLTTPNSRKYGGTQSYVAVNSITAPPATMDFTLWCNESCQVNCSASASPASGLPPLTVAFSASASPSGCNTGASYRWDFGDGTTGSGAGLSHTYTSEGLFAWTLYSQADGALCQSSGIVSVGTCSVTCTATAPSSAIVNNLVSFQSSAQASAACAGAIAYDWDFGDGTAHSSQQNPSHTYASVGTFTWRLTATAGGTACSKAGTVFIQGPCSVQCSASATPVSGAAPLTVAFTATASSSNCQGGLTYLWEFGDGATTTQQNPTHVYSVAGVYTWRMSAVAGGAGCVETGTITVTGPLPCDLSCSASAIPVSGTAPLQVVFDSTVTAPNCTGAPDYLWQFGDGSSSSAADPLHTYSNPGVYTWTLLVSQNGLTCLESGTVTVDAGPCPLTCDGEAAPSSGPAPLSVTFVANYSAPGCQGTPSFSWTFGDGSASTDQNPAHTYTAPGSYDWALTITLEGQTCSDSGTVTVSPPCSLACTASASPSSGQAPVTVAFSASVSPSNCSSAPAYSWLFGDGDSSSEQNPSHTYDEPGLYAWSLTVTADGATCQQTGTVEVAAPCVLACTATASPATGGLPLTVSFSAEAGASGCSGVAVYAWDFGDGSLSSEQSPSHTYTQAGTFSWSLTVGQDGKVCAQSGAVEVTAGLPGDADGDGVVSIGEVQQVINMFLGTQAPGNGADCDGDGVISIGEVQKVINAFLGTASSC